MGQKKSAGERERVLPAKGVKRAGAPVGRDRGQMAFWRIPDPVEGAGCRRCSTRIRQSLRQKDRTTFWKAAIDW